MRKTIGYNKTQQSNNISTKTIQKHNYLKILFVYLFFLQFAQLQKFNFCEFDPQNPSVDTTTNLIAKFSFDQDYNQDEIYFELDQQKWPDNPKQDNIFNSGVCTQIAPDPASEQYLSNCNISSRRGKLECVFNKLLLIPASTNITINCTNLYTANTIAPYDDLFFFSDYTGAESCTSAFQNTDTYELIESSFDLEHQSTGNDIIVQEQAKGTLQFSFNVPVLQSGSAVHVTLPTELAISKTKSDYSWSGNCQNIAEGDIVFNGDHKIEFNGNVLSTSNTGSKFTCTLILNNMVAPNYVQNIGNPQVQIFQQLNKLVGDKNNIQNNNTTPLRGGFSKIDIQPQQLLNAKVGEKDTYVFSIRPRHTLTLGAILQIDFPEQIQPDLGTRNCDKVAGADDNLNNQMNCEVVVQGSTRRLTVSNIFQSTNYDGNYDINFELPGVQNPLSFKQTDTFLVYAFYSDISQLVDDNQNGPQAQIQIAKHGELDNGKITVTPSSQVVGDDNQNLQIQFENINPIPANGFIKLSIPSEFQISGSIDHIIRVDSVNSILTCDVNWECQVPNEIPLNKEILITLNNIVNPSVVKSYSGFIIETTTDNQGGFIYEIDISNQSKEVQMTTPRAFQAVPGISRNNQKNAEIADYTFQFQLDLEHKNGSNFIISFPEEIRSFQATTFECPTTSDPINVIRSQVSCQVQGAQNNQVRATVNLSPGSEELPKGSILRITVPGVLNYFSYKESGNFEYETNAGDPAELQQRQAGTTVTNTMRASIINPVIRAVDNEDYLQEESRWTFSFDLKTVIPVNGYIRLTLPSGFGYKNGSITMNAIVGNLEPEEETVTGITPGATQLTFKQIMNTADTQVSISFILSTFINPSSEQSDNFRIETFDEASNEMDYVSTSITYELTCNLPCRSCNPPSELDKCLSCYQQSINPNHLWDDTNFLCKSNCGDGFYDDGSGNCEQCGGFCETCSKPVSDIQCSRCEQNYYLLDHRCHERCDDGYYENDVQRRCIECTNNCDNCESDVICTSCDPTYYLNTEQRTCITKSECEALGKVVDGSECVSCSPPCFECQDRKDKCTACTGQFYLSGNECVMTCPDNFGKVEISKSCEPCTPPCLTCQKSITDCDTCTISFVRQPGDIGVCDTDCPDFYFADNVQRVCEPCITPCSTCSSQTVCKTCLPAFPYLHQNTCLKSCPEDYPHPRSGGCLTHMEVCADKCSQCYDEDRCYRCKPNLFLMNEACIPECPDGFEPSNDFSTCVKEEPEPPPTNTTQPPAPTNSTTQVIQKNFESKQYLPIPVTIVAFFFGLSVYMSKKSFPKTFVAGSLVALISLFEFISWIVLFMYYIYEKEYTVTKVDDYINTTWTMLFFGTCIAGNYVLNILYLIFFFIKIYSDKRYSEWRNSKGVHQFTNIMIRMFGVLTTFKINRILYSRYFGRTSFNMKLENIHKLSPVSYATFFSVIICSIPILIASGTVAYFDTKKEQFFIQAIDVIILTLITLILMIYEHFKEDKFFEEIEEDKQILNGSLIQQLQASLQASMIQPHNWLTDGFQNAMSESEVSEIRHDDQLGIKSSPNNKDGTERFSPQGKRLQKRRTNHKHPFLLKPISEEEEIKKKQQGLINNNLNSDNKTGFGQSTQIDISQGKASASRNYEDEFNSQPAEYYDDDYDPPEPVNQQNNGRQQSQFKGVGPGDRQMSKGFNVQGGQMEDDNNLEDDFLQQEDEQEFDMDNDNILLDEDDQEVTDNFGENYFKDQQLQESDGELEDNNQEKKKPNQSRKQRQDQQRLGIMQNTTQQETLATQGQEDDQMLNGDQNSRRQQRAQKTPGKNLENSQKNNSDQQVVENKERKYSKSPLKKRQPSSKLQDDNVADSNDNNQVQQDEELLAPQVLVVANNNNDNNDQKQNKENGQKNDGKTDDNKQMQNQNQENQDNGQSNNDQKQENDKNNQKSKTNLHQDDSRNKLMQSQQSNASSKNKLLQSSKDNNNNNDKGSKQDLLQNNNNKSRKNSKSLKSNKVLPTPVPVPVPVPVPTKNQKDKNQENKDQEKAQKQQEDQQENNKEKDQQNGQKEDEPLFEEEIPDKGQNSIPQQLQKDQQLQDKNNNLDKDKSNQASQQQINNNKNNQQENPDQNSNDNNSKNNNNPQQQKQQQQQHQKQAENQENPQQNPQQQEQQQQQKSNNPSQIQQQPSQQLQQDANNPSQNQQQQQSSQQNLQQSQVQNPSKQSLQQSQKSLAAEQQLQQQPQQQQKLLVNQPSQQSQIQSNQQLQQQQNPQSTQQLQQQPSQKSVQPQQQSNQQLQEQKQPSQKSIQQQQSNQQLKKEPSQQQQSDQPQKQQQSAQNIPQQQQEPSQKQSQQQIPQQDQESQPQNQKPNNNNLLSQQQSVQQLQEVPPESNNNEDNLFENQDVKNNNQTQQEGSMVPQQNNNQNQDDNNNNQTSVVAGLIGINNGANDKDKNPAQQQEEEEEQKKKKTDKKGSKNKKIIPKKGSKKQVQQGDQKDNIDPQQQQQNGDDQQPFEVDQNNNNNEAQIPNQQEQKNNNDGSQKNNTVDQEDPQQGDNNNNINQQENQQGNPQKDTFDPQQYHQEENNPQQPTINNNILLLSSSSSDNGNDQEEDQVIYAESPEKQENQQEKQPDKKSNKKKNVLKRQQQQPKQQQKNRDSTPSKTNKNNNNNKNIQQKGGPRNNENSSPNKVDKNKRNQQGQKVSQSNKSPLPMNKNSNKLDKQQQQMKSAGQSPPSKNQLSQQQGKKTKIVNQYKKSPQQKQKKNIKNKGAINTTQDELEQILQDQQQQQQTEDKETEDDFLNRNDQQPLQILKQGGLEESSDTNPNEIWDYYHQNQQEKSMGNSKNNGNKNNLKSRENKNNNNKKQSISDNNSQNNMSNNENHVYNEMLQQESEIIPQNDQDFNDDDDIIDKDQDLQDQQILDNNQKLNNFDLLNKQYNDLFQENEVDPDYRISHPIQQQQQQQQQQQLSQVSQSQNSRQYTIPAFQNMIDFSQDSEFGNNNQHDQFHQQNSFQNRQNFHQVDDLPPTINQNTMPNYSDFDNNMDSNTSNNGLKHQNRSISLNRSNNNHNNSGGSLGITPLKTGKVRAKSQKNSKNLVNKNGLKNKKPPNNNNNKSSQSSLIFKKGNKKNLNDPDFLYGDDNPVFYAQQGKNKQSDKNFRVSLPMTHKNQKLQTIEKIYLQSNNDLDSQRKMGASKASMKKLAGNIRNMGYENNDGVSFLDDSEF